MDEYERYVIIFVSLPSIFSYAGEYCFKFLKIEKKSGGFFSFPGGEVPNGHARVSPTDEEVPITMRSNADFTAVQQKLAVKKPFYKGLFKWVSFQFLMLFFPRGGVKFQLEKTNQILHLLLISAILS